MRTFRWKFLLVFIIISAQVIDCGCLIELPRQGSSNEYPQSMFLSRNRKIMYTLWTPVLLYKCELQFYYIKVGFKGVSIIFVMKIYIVGPHHKYQLHTLYCEIKYFLEGKKNSLCHHRSSSWSYDSLYELHQMPLASCLGLNYLSHVTQNKTMCIYSSRQGNDSGLSSR